MAPRAASPPRREQDLIVIPEAAEPRRWWPIAAFVAGVVALVVIAALVAYGFDQRDRADALEAEVARGVDDQRALLDATTQLRADNAALEGRVAGLQGDVRRAQQGKDVVAASRQEARRNAQQARQALEDEQARFRAYMGPPVGDGAHVGLLVAVGADQSPARITTDLGRWFTGRAATQAAIADGAIAEGESVPRYFRDDDTTWRTMPLDPSATVTVRRWGGGVRYTITLAELQRMMRAGSERAHRITSNPFRLTVVDGRVTAFSQLRSV